MNRTTAPLSVAAFVAAVVLVAVLPAAHAQSNDTPGATTTTTAEPVTTTTTEPLVDPGPPPSTTTPPGSVPDGDGVDGPTIDPETGLIAYPEPPHPDDYGFTVTPTSGPAGTMVTISGYGCLPNFNPGFAEIAFSDWELFPYAGVDADADGRFSTTVTVPDTVAVGPQRVLVACFNAQGSDAAFSLGEQGFEVTARAATPLRSNPAFTG